MKLLGTARGVVENIRQWFAGIVAAFNKATGHFSRPGQIPSRYHGWKVGPNALR